MQPVIITVVRDFEMYEKCVKNNAHLSDCLLCPIDNRVENDYITTCYNREIRRLLNNDAWIVFCHEDFEFLENPAPLLEAADKDSIYGPIGGVIYSEKHWLLKERWSGVFRGKIMESEKDGSNVIESGINVPMETEVDTLDCQCMIVHSSLLRKFALRFDERLSFDLYVEDFCINAFLRYGVKTRILQIGCQHYSRGKVMPRFHEQLKYLASKYPEYEAFGAVGYFIGGGRTPVRRVQKKVRIFLDRYCPWIVRLLLKMI